VGRYLRLPRISSPDVGVDGGGGCTTATTSGDGVGAASDGTVARALAVGRPDPADDVPVDPGLDTDGVAVGAIVGTGVAAASWIADRAPCVIADRTKAGALRTASEK
jgi:hypothetical protein